MKLKILSLVVILFVMSSLTVLSKEVTLPQCDNKSTCVNDKNFYVEVKRVVRRGDVVIVQLVYIGKRNRSDKFYAYFGNTSGYAMILDSEGHEFKIIGKDIENFRIGYGEKKVVSFRFGGDEKKKIVEPFDLTIKADRPHGEITLFDLKQESWFGRGTSSDIKK